VKNNLLFFLIIFFPIYLSAQDLWQEVRSGNFNQYSLNISSGGNIFVITDNILIRSTDIGISWQEIDSISYTFGASPTGVIYLQKDTLFKSYDEGETWIIADDSATVSPLWFLICNPEGDIFTETGVLIGSYSFRSTNEGSSWEKIGIDGSFLNDIIFKNNLTFAAYDASPGQSSLYKSTNKGDDWENIASAPVNVYTLFASRNGNLYGGRTHYFSNPTPDFLFRSTDNGVNWSPLGSGIITKPVLDIEENQLGYLYAAVDSLGVFRSTDSGDTWEPINNGLDFLSVTKLAVDSLGYLYVLAGNNRFSQTKLYRSIETTIPVELISFSARIELNDVLLSWITATETNNAGFEIQRSSPLSQSSESEKGDWQTLSFIQGAGTITESQFYSFKDEAIPIGFYKYRLKQINHDGTFEYSNIIEIEINTPIIFYLHQNYPNPFNPTTKIKFSIPSNQTPIRGGARGGLVTLKVYDVLGNEVATLVNEQKSSGEYEVEFDGSNLASGIYFYQIKIADSQSSSGQIFIQAKKMILMR
jgi:photosystem II stability/assembly factor-like uncharacterized protein